MDKLAANLTKRLDLHAEGKIKEFEESAKKEVEELKEEQHGVELLHHIGYVYEQEARQHLGGLFGFAAEVTEKAHLIRETVSAVKAAVQLQVEAIICSLVMKVLRVHQQQAQKEIEQAEPAVKAQLEQKFVDEGMSTLFKVGKLEVETVLRRVCEIALSDPKLDKSLLRKRAEALKTLGRIFKAAK